MKKYVKLQDVVVVVILLTISILGIVFFLFQRLGSLKEPLQYAIVSVNTQEELEIPLDKPAKITLLSNPNIVFEVRENGSIGFISSDCPDHVCIKSGFLSSPGDIAVCLPNKTTLSISGNDPTVSEVDTIT